MTRPLDLFQETTTNNNVAQGIMEIVTTNNSSASMLVWIIVRRVSDGATQGWTFQGAYKNVSGVVTPANQLLGAIQGSSADKTALAACAIAVTTSGNNLRITGAGLAATNLNWSVYVLGLELS